MSRIRRDVQPPRRLACGSYALVVIAVTSSMAERGGDWQPVKKVVRSSG